MTIQATSRVAGPFAGNGVNTSFPFTFKVFSAADLVVYVIDANANVSPVANYSVALNVDQDASPGGTVTYPAAGAPLAIGNSLVIETDEALLQDTSLPSGSAWLPTVVTQRFDYLTILVQNLTRSLSRALRFPDGDQASAQIGSVDNRKGKYLFFNAITGAVEYATAIIGATLSQSVVGQFLYPQSAAELAAAITPTNYQYEPGNVLRYGTNTVPGTTDMSTAFQRASNVIASHDMVVPPGDYNLSSQVTFTLTHRRCHVWAYGAHIKSNALANYPIKISGIVVGGLTIHGMKIDHTGNTTSLGGFDIVGAWYTTLEDCFVTAGPAAANYAGVRIRNSDPNNDGTSSLWTNIERLRMWPADGATKVNAGVRIQGPSNATTISRGSFASVTNGVLVVPETGKDNIVNSLLVEGTAFEDYTNAISYVGSGVSSVAGARFQCNRYETGTKIYVFSGIGSLSQAPFSFGSTIISSAGTYLTGLTTDNFNSLDPSVTPDGYLKLFNETGLTVGATTGDAYDTFVPVGAGYSLRRTDGVQVATLRPRTGSGAILKGSAANLFLMEVNTIGKSSAEDGQIIIFGIGSPEGVYPAAIGSLFLRSNGGAGTSMYVKESGAGNTGWVAK